MNGMVDASVAARREQLARDREVLRQEFYRERDPVKTLSRYTAQVDELVGRVAGPHLSQAPFCVAAMGGYGRRELYPCSDVDLLLFYREAAKQACQQGIKAFLHELWDLNFHLGQQVCSVEEARSVDAEDFEFILALLDARPVAGESVLAVELIQEVIPALIRQYRKELTERILSALEQRHQSYRDTIYQLEPDVKHAPGGLRDYLTGRWLLRLNRRRAFVPYSEAEIEGARDFLSAIRIFLHFKSGRDQNRLSHRLQEELAHLWGYSGKTPHSGVEAFMKEYFLRARMLDGFCRKIARDQRPRAGRGEMEAPAGSLADAGALLEIFHRSLMEQKPLGDSARNAVVSGLSCLSQTDRLAGLRPLLGELFQPRRGLYETLTEMYELGVLGRLFPEFETIKARVIRDFYHKYTVDEHTLLAIKSVEDLLTTEDPSDRRFQSLLSETPDGELLTLALLLHDVGKSHPGKHVERSVRMARRALKRFRFPREDVDHMLFLIRHHLALSSVMFRRDLEDPKEILRLADLINDTGRLRLLCLLTYADIKAVGPGTLSEWKKDLLWQLYVSVYHRLTFGYGEQRIVEEDVGEKLLAKLPAGLDPQGFEHFLEGFPRRYLTSTPAEEIYQHYRLASRLDADNPVQLRLSHRGTHWELCVVTPDRYFLFAKIVGLLSYFDMNILRGYGFSNRQNTVLDFFQFDDTRSVFDLNPQEKDHYRQLLVAAVQDQVSVAKLLEGKEKSVIFQPLSSRFEPTLYFEPDYPGPYTIMEIVAPDSIGLLYRIGREISGLRCNIELVLINTEGDKAVDVFYLTQQGRRLDAEMQEELAARIIRSLTGPEPRAPQAGQQAKTRRSPEGAANRRGTP